MKTGIKAQQKRKLLERFKKYKINGDKNIFISFSVLDRSGFPTKKNLNTWEIRRLTDLISDKSCPISRTKTKIKENRITGKMIFDVFINIGNLIFNFIFIGTLSKKLTKNKHKRITEEIFNIKNTVKSENADLSSM